MNMQTLFYPSLHNLRNIIQPNNLCIRILSVYSRKNFSSKSQLPLTTTMKVADGTEKKKKKALIPRITLIGQDENISIITLEEAEKLSKRRELKLVKILDFDTKTQRPVYKLMTGTEYLAEDLKRREHRKNERNSGNTIKGDKVLMISSNISEHDLNNQINKITKWIVKNYEVRVTINGDAGNMEKAESIYTMLNNQTAGIGRVIQKRTSGSDIKFQILPPKKSKENEKNS